MHVLRPDFTAIAAALALVASASWAQPVPPRAPAVPDTSVPVARTMEELRRELTDREISVLVVAEKESTLSSQMAGKIKKINAGLGDVVRAGVPLVEFDCGEQDAQLQTARAEYRGARETHLTKLRLQALGAAGELEVTVAAAAADRAQSQIDLRQSQMAYCIVSAPFAGRVARVRVKTAESVALGQPLLELVSPGSLKAQLYVPAAWVRWIKTGTRFEVRTEDQRVHRARVSRINPRVEGVSQALEIEGRFEGSKQLLLPGMVGTAVFPDRPKQ